MSKFNRKNDNGVIYRIIKKGFSHTVKVITGNSSVDLDYFVSHTVARLYAESLKPINKG